MNSLQFNGWAGNHFIWCGVSGGGGGLNLTIQDGSGKLLVQTTAYIQIVDIKQIIELDTPTIAPAVPRKKSDAGLASRQMNATQGSKVCLQSD